MSHRVPMTTATARGLFPEPARAGARRFARCMLGAALLAAALPASAQPDFTIIALPDTQNYSQDNPAIYDAQTQWIAGEYTNPASPLNILFVTHLGDVVNIGTDPSEEYQWINARNAHNIMESVGVPVGVCVGNHDIWGTDGGGFTGGGYDPVGAKFLEYFGPQWYSQNAWFGGASPSGLSTFQLIDLPNGQTMLFLHLLIETPPAELAWAQGVLNANRDKPTWVSTHRYLFDWRLPFIGQGRYDDFNYIFEPLYRHDGIQSEEFFQNFVRANKQIFTVTCGHNDGEYRQVSTNNFGLPVHEVLADYQTTYGAGGNGWLRLHKFYLSQNRVDIDTYSPWLGAFAPTSDSRFSLNVNLADYVTDLPLLRFQNGVAGYNGTQDTWVNEDSKNSSDGTSPVLQVDDDIANSWFNDYAAQGLVRFDNLFQGPVREGDPAPTRIPAGAAIVRASLTINVSDDIDDPLQGYDFYLYRMTRDWNESSTWNSLSNGVEIGIDTDSQRVATFDGDNVPNGNEVRNLDVTAAVQSWQGGAANYGLAILPERVNWGDDGITIRSSEDSNVTFRPALDVEFTYDVLNAPPVVTAPLAVAQTTVDEGFELRMTISASDPNPLDPLVFALNGADVAFATGSGDVELFRAFEDDGVYSLAATVRDDEDIVAAGALTITVVNVPPTLEMVDLPMTATPGAAFGFSATAFDPGALDVLSFAWDFDNDGQFDDVLGASGTWIFATPGEYPVSVRVMDDDGGADSATFVVSVIADCPADLTGDGRVDLGDLGLVLGCWGQPCGDLNGDDQTGLGDLGVLFAAWGPCGG